MSFLDECDSGETEVYAAAHAATLAEMKLDLATRLGVQFASGRQQPQILAIGDMEGARRDPLFSDAVVTAEANAAKLSVVLGTVAGVLSSILSLHAAAAEVPEEKSAARPVFVSERTAATAKDLLSTCERLATEDVPRDVSFIVVEIGGSSSVSEKGEGCVAEIRKLVRSTRQLLRGASAAAKKKEEGGLPPLFMLPAEVEQFALAGGAVELAVDDW